MSNTKVVLITGVSSGTGRSAAIRFSKQESRGGKFKGRIKLVAILAPVTHAFGTNYASTRLEATVQYRTNAGNWATGRRDPMVSR